ncbi:MAG: hypothetical protein N3C60_00945 [Calditerrivibrio sp.]|nr:hypothetical protein [Calditerrivibrio sp.]
MTYLFLNYYIKHNINSLIRTKPNISIKIDRVESVLTPFYIHLRGVKIEVDKATFEIEKLSLHFHPLNFIRKKPYIDIETSRVTGDIPQYFWEQPFLHIDMNIINRLDIAGADITNSYKGILTKIDTNIIKYEVGGFLNIPYMKGYISKGKISEQFVGRIKFFYNQNILKIDYIDIKGDDFFVSFMKSEKKLNTDHFYSDFEMFFNNRFIELIDKDLSGKIVLKGYIDGTNIKSKVSGELSFKDHLAKFTLKANSILNESIKIQSENLTIDNTPAKLYGTFDVKSKRIDSNIHFDLPFPVYNNEDINIKIKKISIDDYNFKKGKLIVHLLSEEEYMLSSDMEKSGTDILFNNMSIKSKTTDLRGNGSYKKGITDLFLAGRVSRNADLTKHIAVAYTGNIDLNLTMLENDFHLTGKYNSHAKQTLYGIVTTGVNGAFEMNKDNLTFSLKAHLEHGTLDLHSNYILKKGVKKYHLTLHNVPFYEIFNFFNVKTALKYPVNGIADISYNNIYSGKAEFTLSNTDFNSTKFKISFQEKVLKVEEVMLDNNTITDPVIFDFKKDTIKGSINLKKFRFKQYPEVSDIKINIQGEISNPKYFGIFRLDDKRIGSRIYHLQGDISKTRISHISSDLKIDTEINISKKELISDISLNRLHIRDNTLTGKLKLYSPDLSTFVLRSEEIFIGDNLSVILKGVSINFTNRGISSGSFILNTENVKNTHISINESHFDKITGKIDVSKSTIYISNLSVKESKGVISFIYPQGKEIELYGNVDLKFDLMLPQLSIRLSNLSTNISLNRYDLTSKITSKSLNAVVISKKYSDKSSYTATGNFNDIFVERSGFYGIVSGTFSYNGYENLLSSNILVEKSIFKYQKFSSSQKRGELNLPFNLNLNINTKDGVKITDSILEGLVKVDLSVTYYKTLTLKGELSLKDSYFYIGKEKFLVTRGSLKILDNETMFVNMEANGSGKLNSTRIFVQGYLPEYKITVYDSKNKGYGLFDANKNQGSKELLSKIISDAVFKDIISTTNRFFGINQVNLEPSPTGGQIKVGRAFSDRIELNYISNLSESKENKFSAEYIIFDWFKINIFSNSKGGTGAGVMFDFNF